ncbi:OmpA family protein [Candidatus Venteria ishoeyi]|uniref:Outer membrane porin F n=1 Tax=Candidatus Venteria ishoeyi TaxID=1899563 RepID=A0A1H6FBS8_9GAMM|nr:OmpA family protein [Candidatus Venteria ishoeyi]MDM8545986.1 OmpA family protein [Candidatus Venteria ishoeyi]SEH06769.1 Outer membrane porin F precursor [Candidatus Venteria ishoeyi]
MKTILFLYALFMLITPARADVQNGLCFLKTQAEIENFYRHGHCAGRSTRVAKGVSKGVSIQPDRVGVLFEFDASALKPEFYALLAEWGSALQNLADMHFSIHGHTDYIGDAAYNLQLSQQRAQSVKDYLVRMYQIDPARLQIAAYGESQPLRGNLQQQSDHDRRWNRRVEFVKMP